jgi:hypothetical protein
LVGENSDSNEILDNQVLDNQVLDNQVLDNQVLDNVAGAPGQPQLYLPADLAVTGVVVEFQWAVGAGADNHRILIDNDSDLLSPVENILYGPLANTHTSGTLAEGTYYWAVIAINEAGENQSLTRSFTVLDSQDEKMLDTLIILDSSDRASMQRAIDFLESNGGHITTVFPPHILIGHVPDNISHDLVDDRIGIVSIHRSVVGLSDVSEYGEMARAGVEAWNRRLRGLPSLLNQADLPYPLENSNTTLQPSNVQALGNGLVTVEYTLAGETGGGGEASVNGLVTVEYTPPYQSAWEIQGSALGGYADGWESLQTGAVSGYVNAIIGGWAEAGGMQYISFTAEGVGDATVEVEMSYVCADTGLGIAGVSGVNYRYIINGQEGEEVIYEGFPTYPWGLISPLLDAIMLLVDAEGVANLFLQYNPTSITRSHSFSVTQGEEYYIYALD